MMDQSFSERCVKDIKIIIVGSSGSGKTSLCKRWINDTYTENSQATIMTEYSHKVYEYQGNAFKIQVWDLAGQDKNIYTTKILTKGAHGTLIVSDVTNEKSFYDTIKWKKAIDETKFIDGDNLPCLLIQNKIDLVKKNEYPDEAKMREFAEKYEFIDYFQTSAKTGINVNECMTTLIEYIIRRLIEHSKNTNTILNNDRKSIVIQNPKEHEALMRIEEKGGCC